MKARAALIAALACTALPARARALDYDVRAETIGQAYQLRGPAGSPVITSRRITQYISLAVVRRPLTVRDVRVAFRMRLRMDADFGEACDPQTNRCLDEVNRERGAEFVPLFARRTMDVPFAYLDVENIGRGVLDVRLGRIFQSDALGFFLFDGARARVHIAQRFVLEAYGGLETRTGFPLSNGRFERDGLIRGDRTGWDADLAPYVLQRELAPSLGVALETEDAQPVYARVGYRRVWTASGISEEKVGGAVQARVGQHVRLFGDAVFSVPQRFLSIARAGFEWNDLRGAHAGMELSRYRPTFDLSSIWAAFWVDPMDEARAFAQWRISPELTLAGHWMVRRYALSEGGPSNGASEARDLWNTGGMVSLHARGLIAQGTVRARAEGGAIGPRAGVDVDGSLWALPGRLRFDARVSLWHVEDELRPQRSGMSFGAVVGAMVRFGTIADVHVNVEDDTNPYVGNRFRLVALLTLRGEL